MSCNLRMIDQAVVGNRLGDIVYAIQRFTEDEKGYGDARELVGHGIQPTMHEAPDVLSYGEPASGLRLRAGMTIDLNRSGQGGHAGHVWPRNCLCRFSNFSLI